MPFIQSFDGTALHVRDMGKGRPVILIHGWPLNEDMWSFQVPALIEAGYRVITYDRRGFGRSDHPASGYEYDQLTDDLACIIDQLGLTNVTLVGFSMGGGEVARFSARHGDERIAQLVFLGAVPPFLLKTADNPEGIENDVVEDIKTQIRLDRFDFLRQFAPNFYGHKESGDKVSAGLLDWTFLMACQASPVATLQCVDAWSKTDFRQDLTAVKRPCLIIHGAADETVPVALSGRRTAKALPHAHFKEYEGAGHGLFATFAHRLNQDLISFLKTSSAE
ncbi:MULTISPECIES: alpha/beta fold hydrolase [unclassified Saccharibacter]|uniref:alpha/beta fold hydrolase n=1 Tax=unclassified Saccharibacter TaxID=2648722 RepID=UPI001328497C|nr:MULTISPECIES: alpha/beta hydrolase [unclassified Saccharibacter]MXV36100.1 alpha/beta fold hydrolase [Saccharibacter sp. EH611]MXV56959.1 alpha/beta fold hydrolase [Saccharibacter sp. EH70]MXV66681.1 alpha/beta fold hydrolase [Saccharibacter sp. EH60]